MNQQDFSLSFSVNQSADEAYAAITNVRGWWSEEIEGSTHKIGAEFKYHFQDAHRCTLRITGLVPGKKVAWHVVDNYFSFTQDKSEWKDTDITFDITRAGDKTTVVFTHHGLKPEYECYAACTEGWSTYILGSLQALITTGKGQPNLGQARTESERALGEHNFTAAFTVEQTPAQVYAAINNVRGWWEGEIDGSTDTPGAVFTYRYADVHRSTQQITELIPGKRVAWHVIDANLSFTRDTAEWKGTDILFDIAQKDGKTEVRFTHRGLVPAFECYNECSNAWSSIIRESLRGLITSGETQPRTQER